MAKKRNLAEIREKLLGGKSRTDIMKEYGLSTKQMDIVMGEVLYYDVMDYIRENPELSNSYEKVAEHFHVSVQDILTVLGIRY